MGVEFTIAIPTHDRRETVLMAVRSVLAQTRPAQRVIVLCDGCSDGTADAVRALGAPQVEALELEKGPGYAYGHRNRALELAQTEAIVWLADDDLLLPDHLERIGALWDRGGVDLVQSGAVRVDPDDALTWMGADWSVPELRARFERENTTPMSSVSVSVALARAAGGWDGAQPRAGDWDLWRRVLAAGARCAMSWEPTHLHFRASGRVQAWPERVRQNGGWLARLGDPAALAELRTLLRRAHEQRDAALASAQLDVYAALDRATAALGAELDAVNADRVALRELHAAVDADRDALRDQLTAACAERDHLAAQLAAAGGARDAAAAEAERLRTALGAIERGGWWRLRERLLPLLRLAGRSR